jgi:hypothetical protein
MAGLLPGHFLLFAVVATPTIAEHRIELCTAKSLSLILRGKRLAVDNLLQAATLI